MRIPTADLRPVMTTSFGYLPGTRVPRSPISTSYVIARSSTVALHDDVQDLFEAESTLIQKRIRDALYQGPVVLDERQGLPARCRESNFIERQRSYGLAIVRGGFIGKYVLDTEFQGARLGNGAGEQHDGHHLRRHLEVARRLQVGPVKLAVDFPFEIRFGRHVIEDESRANGGDGVRGFMEGGDSGNSHTEVSHEGREMVDGTGLEPVTPAV